MLLQRLPRPEQMPLTDHLVKRARAQSLGQRRMRIRGGQGSTDRSDITVEQGLLRTHGPIVAVHPGLELRRRSGAFAAMCERPAAAHCMTTRSGRRLSNDPAPPSMELT